MICGPRRTNSPIQPGGRSRFASSSTIAASVSGHGTPMMPFLVRPSGFAVGHRCGLGQPIPLNHEAARGALERLPYLGGVEPGQQDHCTATVDTAVHAYGQAVDVEEGRDAQGRLSFLLVAIGILIP